MIVGFKMEYQKVCVCVYRSVLKAYQFSIYSHLSLRQTLWGQHNVSMLERCPSCRESFKRSKESLETTLGVC